MAYLGTDQPSLNLNFSKNANMVVAQYYQFLRLGFEGYRKIMSNLMKVSAHLAEGILATGLTALHSAPSVLIDMGILLIEHPLYIMLQPLLQTSLLWTSACCGRGEGI